MSLRSGLLVRGDGVVPWDRTPRPPCVPGDALVAAVLKARESVPGDGCARGPDSSPRPCPARCGPTRRLPLDTSEDRPLAAHGHEDFSRDNRTDHARPAAELPGTRTREKTEGGFAGPRGLRPPLPGILLPSGSHEPHTGTAGPPPTDPAAPSPGEPPSRLR